MLAACAQDAATKSTAVLEPSQLRHDGIIPEHFESTTLDGEEEVCARPNPTSLPSSGQVNRARSTSEEPQPATNDSIPRWPFLCLTVQHFSSSWCERSTEFAAPLYLVVLFPTSLVPSALLGLLTTGAALLGSGWIGGLVDTTPRLVYVRAAIALQKTAGAVSLALYVVLFGPLRQATASAWAASPTVLATTGSASVTLHGFVYLLLVAIILFSAMAGLASGGLNTAIQRDWVMTIAADDSAKLTVLNTWLRRVDLVCKLLAPLFISLLTTAASYRFSVFFLLAFTVVSGAYELVLVKYVYSSFPVLAEDEVARRAAASAAPADPGKKASFEGMVRATRDSLSQMGKDLAEFARLPIFLTSLSISCVYLTTLSFDGTMLAYLKSQRGFSDPFIAGMRGAAVVAGLAGTLVMPVLERRVGLVRGGAWSVWAEAVCLAPALVSLYVGLPAHAPPGPGAPWNAGVFFAAIALSRIGLWSFDLIQLQTLQEALRAHPRRSRLAGLQLSLQAAFDLAKYALVLALNRPAQFRWTALVSFVAVVLAGVLYTVFLWRTRGHVLHWTWLRLGSKEEHREEQHEMARRDAESARMSGDSGGLTRRQRDVVVDAQ